MKRVLLVSASRVFLKRNANLLQGRGFQLYTVTSGTEALKLHKEGLFDLILADLKLEDMCGCTLFSLVRSETGSQHVPFVLICHKISGSIERVEQCSASATLVKPIDPIQLIETIGTLLEMPIGRSKRVVLNVRVLVKKTELEFYCLSRDISTTGILLEAEYHLELGTRIICQFTLQGFNRIETEGEVVRYVNKLEDEALYGVKFIDLPRHSLKDIERYLATIVTPASGVSHRMQPVTSGLAETFSGTDI